MKNLILLLIALFIIFFLSIQIIYGKSGPSDLKKHVFKIDGKITYKNDHGYVRGLYGATVVLHMLKKGDGMIAALTGIGLDPKDLKVSLQPDGSFSFNLQMLSNLIMFDRIFLEVYPGDTHGSINYDDLQYITTSSIGKVTVWNKQVSGLPFRGIELPFDNNQMNHEFHNMQMEVMPNFGSACRYLKIANEFGKWFYKKINQNINIPPITVGVVKKFSHDIVVPIKAGGYFQNTGPGPTPRIELLFYLPYKENTTAHEYGHYLHYLLNKGNFFLWEKSLSLTNKEIVYYYESIADFFNMAIRKYAEVIYGDSFSTIDNFEKLPFDIPSFKLCHYCQYDSYTSPMWASYLWNIFDGPSQNFGKEGYIVYDNDDVDGEKEGWYKEIFNFISTSAINPGFRIKHYLHDQVKRRKGKEKLAVSLEHMYKFLLQRIGHKMLPVQVKGVNFGIMDDKDHSIDIYFNHYPGDINYKNPPTGYRVYGKKGNVWVLIKEFPYKNQSPDVKRQFETILTKDIAPYKNFRITAYNEVGESLHPYEFVNNSLPITIEGPTNIIAGNLYQWRAKLTGGVQPIEYFWKLKKPDGLPEYKPVSLSPYITTTAPENQNFILQIWARDANRATAYAQIQVNTTILPLKASITGTSLVAAYQTNYWQAKVTGGIPPYSYSWIKQMNNHGALQFIGNSAACSTKTDQSFTLKLQVKDSRGTTVVVTKPIELNTQAAAISIIDGAKLVYLHQNNNQWKTTVIGGIPPYEISWYRKYENELSYSLVATGNTYQKGYIEKEGVFYLKTTVKDATGVIRESAPYKVTALYQPLYAAILNENVILKTTDKVTWQADITGGKPFYYCSWKVGKDVNNLAAIKQGHIGYELHPSCEYQPKFNDAGKYTIALTVKDTEGKEIIIYKDFTVVGIGKDNKQDANSLPPIKFTIYPNPAPGLFTLNYTLTEDANVIVSLVSVNDNKESIIYQQQHTKGTYNKTFNTRLFPIGNYILKITQKDIKGNIGIRTEKILLLK